MTDVKPVNEGGAEYPEKRKLDLPNSINKSLEVDNEKDDSTKRQKTEIPAGENGSVPVFAAGESVAKSDENLTVEEGDDEDDDDDDEEDYDAEQDEDGDEDENAKAENVDRKGKGIVMDDKGKGKMIEDSENDDSDGRDGDDDTSDDSDSVLSDGLDESDLDDDPLAEVDLDNILPSRTRQRQVQPGVRILNDPDKGNNASSRIF